MEKEIKQTEYDRKIKEFKIAKETFRNKLMKLATKLIDDEKIEKTPEMVLAIAEVSKICLDGFKPSIDFMGSLKSSQGSQEKSPEWFL